MYLTKTDLDELIKKTIAEVLGKMLPDSGLQVKEPASGTVCKGRLLAIIPDIAIDLGKHVDFLRDQYSGYEITVGYLGGERGIPDPVSSIKVQEAVYLKDELSNCRLIEKAGCFDEICFVSPSIVQMEAIACGNDANLPERLALYFLLHKKRFSITLDYNIKSLPACTFSTKMANLLNEIENMGIYINTLGEEKVIESSGTTGKRELITEKDIENMWYKGVRKIKNPKNYIITPLAVDRAKELGLLIL